MFVLREGHMNAFVAAARESFEGRLLRDLQRRFSGECQRVGEKAVRQRIRQGIDQAAADGVSGEGAVADRIRASFNPCTARAPEKLGEHGPPARA